MIDVIGEALIDVVVSGDGIQVDALPGGAPMNVAIGIARLGQPDFQLFASDPVLQFVRGPVGDHLAMVDHAHLVAGLDLLDVMRRHQHGDLAQR